MSIDKRLRSKGKTGIALANRSTTDLDLHIADTSAAHSASAISNSAGTNTYATDADVQGAIDQLDAEAVARDGRLDTLEGHFDNTAISDLNLTISDPPTIAEVQAVSNKVDEILAMLRTATIIST